jgi:hypothetical protein
VDVAIEEEAPLEKVAASMEAAPAPLGAAAPAEPAAALGAAGVMPARTEDGRFVCPHCGRSYATKRVLDLHILRKHMVPVPVICSCGQPFRVPEDRDAHMKREIHQRRMVRYVSRVGCKYK